MTRRIKAFCILAVLALLGLVSRADAATYSVNINSSQFIPSYFTTNLLVGDSVTFRISGQGNHTLDVNGTVIATAIASGMEVNYVFNTDGTFRVYDSFRQSIMNITVVQPVNIAPSFTQLLPANRTALLVTNAMTNITLRATVADEDGSIRRVDFRYGVTTNIASLTNLIGTITNSTVNTNNTDFSIVWPNALPGRYLFQARAYDNKEVSVNSARFVLNLYSPFTNTAPVLTNSTQYVFTHNADTNLVYISERSIDMTNWTAFVTNVATNSIVQVLDLNTNNYTNVFYRVVLSP